MNIAGGKGHNAYNASSRKERRKGIRVLRVTELLHGNTWQSSVDLPLPLTGHCLVKINSSHVFLVGGKSNTGYSTYIYSRAAGFIRQADRGNSSTGLTSCALLGDNIWVVGGRRRIVQGWMKWKWDLFSEYFSLSTSTWLPGPTLPNASTGRMITSGGKIIFLASSRSIWQLETTGLGRVEDGTWEEVGKMKNKRSSFDVIKMNKKDCINWNV